MKTGERHQAISCLLFAIAMTQAPDITIATLLNGLSPDVNGEAINNIRCAYDFACRAHGQRRRSSGELYTDHDLAVAQTVLQLGLDDPTTLIVSLLHDVLRPHTGINQAAVAQSFGKEVAKLVSGVNELDNYVKQASQRANIVELGTKGIDRRTLEAIRRAILSIVDDDIRIILIRMADSLQELRKASNLQPERQLQIAYEAMHIFAQIANRLGIWQLKWELEDLAFRYLDPGQYRDIARRLDEKREQRTSRIEQAAAKLRNKLKEMNLRATVTGRPKHLYSIYRKMTRKQVDFDQIYDLEALRIILEPSDPAAYESKTNKEKDDEDRALCYQVLGAVHSLWQPIPREFDDYIASPKTNGYKSLHTAVLDIETGQRLEIQIRTVRMHLEAEKGVAAHWAYKEQEGRWSTSLQRRIQTLRGLLATLQEEDVVGENGESLEIERLEERIHVFTPLGDVVDLPSGSTPIDFAYQIHTEIGHRCRGARVNSKIVSLDCKLKSGDRVEILTAKRGGPNRDWMNPSMGYTATPRTRSKIRQWFRQQEREQNIIRGREVVERELRRLGLADGYSIQEIAAALKYRDVAEFLAKVGFGDIQSAQVSGAISLMHQSLSPEDEELLPLLRPKPKGKGLIVKGVTGLYTKLAGCCNPAPPEPIVGYITRGSGITIHHRDCPQLANMQGEDRQRIIDEGVEWGTDTDTHPVPIVVRAYRRPGLIEDMINILRGQQISIPSTKTVTANSIMTVYLIAEVTDLKQLEYLLTKFDNLPNVIEAHRQRWS